MHILIAQFQDRSNLHLKEWLKHCLLHKKPMMWYCDSLASKVSLHSPFGNWKFKLWTKKWLWIKLCFNINFGLVIKVGAQKKMKDRRMCWNSHTFDYGKMQKKWIFEISKWESLGSWSSKLFWIFGTKCRWQIIFKLNKFYIIDFFLKCRCQRWACAFHLEIWNSSYDQKKG